MTSKNDNLNREAIIAATTDAYERLRNDPEAWAAYQAELKEWDAMPSPGLEDEPYRDEEANQMPDTTMTDKERREKFLDWFLLVILRRIDEGEYHEVDHAVGDAQCLARYFRTLQTRLEQAHWDAISRDQTIENLRAENARYREALEFYAAHGGERARAALGMGVTP